MFICVMPILTEKSALSAVSAQKPSISRICDQIIRILGIMSGGREILKILCTSHFSKDQ